MSFWQIQVMNKCMFWIAARFAVNNLSAQSLWHSLVLLLTRLAVGWSFVPTLTAPAIPKCLSVAVGEVRQVSLIPACRWTCHDSLPRSQVFPTHICHRFTRLAANLSCTLALSLAATITAPLVAF